MSVIGIDFGDQNSYVAVARQGGIEIVINDYSLRNTPTCVAFGSECRVLGVAGKNQHGLNFRNTVTGFKEAVGRRASDPVVRNLANHATYKLAEMRGGAAGVEVELAGERLTLSISQITSMLLGHLRECAQKYVKAGIVDCVLAVPHYWTDAQRRALLDAAKITGLNVLRLMNETTAVALNYGIYKQDLPDKEKDKPRHVAFVDIGHSAMQAYICQFHKGQLQMKAVVFDPNLGGRDMTAALRSHFIDDFNSRYRLDVASSPRAMLRLFDECEKLKKQMSANSTSIPLNIECFMEDKDVTGKMNRADFEDKCGSIWQRIESLLVSLLKQAKLTAADVHSCEVVGGATRVPRVKQIVKQVFGSEPSTTLNADEAVAKGCALQAAILSPAFRVREFSLTDIQPYSIKLSWSAEKSEDGEWEAFPEGHQFPFSKMLTFYRTEPFSLEAAYSLPNHIPYPTTQIGKYIISNVTPLAGGESRKVKAKIRLNPNGLFLVSSAHMYEPKTDEEAAKEEEKKDAKKPAAGKKSPGKQKTTDDSAEKQEDGESQNNAATDEVNNENGNDANDDDTMDADQQENANDKKKIKMKAIDLPIQTEQLGMTQRELDDLRDVESRLARQDAEFKARADAKNAVEEYVYDMRDKLIDSFADYVSPADADRFKGELEATENWLYDEGSEQSKQVYVDRLAELKRTGDPIVERHAEAQDRPAAFQELSTAVMRARKVLDASASGDPAYDHLTDAELETVNKFVNEKQSWFDSNMSKQQQRPLYQPPVVTVQEIYQEKKAFETVVNPIINKPKPKVEPPKDDKKDEKQEEDASMAENGPATEEKEKTMEVD